MLKLRPPSRENPGALANALTCAWASWLAYSAGSELEAKSTECGLHVAGHMLAEANFAVVLDISDARLVAFRGTDEAADWLSNLDVLFARTPWGRVHRGFHRAADVLWSSILGPVLAGVELGKSIWITGHSLGGAIAVITAARLSFECGMDVAGLFTFGQPRVGGSSFCKKLDSAFRDRYWRFVNHTDVVSDVPIIFRRHAGQLRYFDVDGRLHRRPTFRRTLTDHILAPGRFGGYSQFAAHEMTEYVELIGASMDAAGSADQVGSD